MTKLILGVVISLSTFLYGQNTEHLQQVSQEVKSLIQNENINDKKVIKKLFKILKSNESILDNWYILSEFRRALYLCKRDNACQMISKKKTLMKMANNMDRGHNFDINEFNKLYDTMDDIDFIFNKMVIKQRKTLIPNDENKVIEILNNISKDNSFNSTKILKQMSIIYNYDFLNTKLERDFQYRSRFVKCINTPCFKSAKEYNKKIDKLNKKYPASEVLSYLDFFNSIDKINKKRLSQKLKIKQKIEEEKLSKKEEKNKMREKVFNSLTKMSKGMGFKGYQSGLEDLLYRLKNGFTKIEYEKDYLWGLVPNDDFLVEGIVGKYVIYTQRNQSDVKIGIIKEKNKFYQKDSYLSTDLYFKLFGVQEFKTVLGVTQQILILKEIPRKY
ncbi:MAG: hypothetical protein QM482_00430 [Sulfurospirillum sp.]